MKGSVSWHMAGDGQRRHAYVGADKYPYCGCAGHPKRMDDPAMPKCKACERFINRMDENERRED